LICSRKVMPRQLFPLLTLLALLTACAEPESTATAITNVTVIDAVNGVRENQTVIFDGDEITAVNSSDMDPAVAETIDGTGKFLIPGLWDFHVHLTYDERFTNSMPALFLSYGITSVRDTGGLMRKVLPVVQKMRAPDAVAPRVFFAGPLLDGNFVVYDGDSRPEIGVRNATPDDARAMIRRLKEQGVDFIKIYEMVSPAVFDAMVETAQELELPIDSHVPLSLRASTAGPLVDSIEHLRNIEMDCASNAPELHETRLELLRNPDGLSGGDLRSSLHSLQRLPAIANYDEARCDRTIEALISTTQVPTLRLGALNLAPPYERDDWQDALSRIRADARVDWQKTSLEIADHPNEDFTAFGEWSLFLVGRMHARGVPIGAGTDTPIFISVPGYSLHSELQLLVRAGLSPLEAIRSATVRPAEFFSLQNEMGTIDVGKRADLVLLDANPLENIANTKRIAAVVSKGKLLTRNELSELVSAAHTAEARVQ
jgi:imidazolonepropionase-like amidohydrolase